jgi:hypothetical protein
MGIVDVSERDCVRACVNRWFQYNERYTNISRNRFLKTPSVVGTIRANIGEEAFCYPLVETRHINLVDDR